MSLQSVVETKKQQQSWLFVIQYFTLYTVPKETDQFHTFSQTQLLNGFWKPGKPQAASPRQTVSTGDKCVMYTHFSNYCGSGADETVATSSTSRTVEQEENTPALSMSKQREVRGRAGFIDSIQALFEEVCLKSLTYPKYENRSSIYHVNPIRNPERLPFKNSFTSSIFFKNLQMAMYVSVI